MRASPNLPDLAQTSRIYSELVSAFFSADLPPAVGEQVAATARALSLGDDSLAAASVRGLTMSHPDWIQASRIRSGLRARWQALFREVDVVLCPPMPTVAFPHDHSPLFARVLDVDGAKVPYFDQSVWAGIATLNGLPATTTPIGHTDSGLPIGVADHRRLPRRPHDDRFCRPDRARIRRLHPTARLLRVAISSRHSRG